MGKIFANLGNNVKKIENFFEKRQPCACVYRMHGTARICSASVMDLLHRNSKQLNDKMLYH